MKRRNPDSRDRWLADGAGYRVCGRTAGRARRNLYRRSGWTVDAAAVTVWRNVGSRWVRYVERTDSYAGRGPLWIPAAGGGR